MGLVTPGLACAWAWGMGLAWGWHTSYLVTGSGTGSFCFFSVGRCGVGGCRWWAGIHRPAAAAACQSLFYGLYKKCTELSANNFQLSLAVLLAWLEPSYQIYWPTNHQAHQTQAQTSD
jgi:hypothetical protein